jgi:type II secretory pathway pseudopilin PulG
MRGVTTRSIRPVYRVDLLATQQKTPNAIAIRTSPSPALRASSPIKVAGKRERGVTLVELLVGMAIATLMTVAGWRAIDAMQSARDRTVSDAARWQSIDTLFATMEADLRRADLANFSGDANALRMRLNPLLPTESPQSVRYQINRTEQGVAQVVRVADTGAIEMTIVRDARFAFRTNPKPATRSTPAEPGIAVTNIGEYPRAVEVALEVLGNANTADAAPRIVNRLMVLR